MAVAFAKPIPHFPRSPGAPLPKYNALIIGINYIWSPDGSEEGDPELRLVGPVNDATAMRNALMGADVWL